MVDKLLLLFYCNFGELINFGLDTDSSEMVKIDATEYNPHLYQGLVVNFLSNLLKGQSRFILHFVSTISMTAIFI